MKFTEQFIIREIAGEHVLIPTGKTAQEFNGMISLTTTARFIWEHLEKVDSIDEMVDAITAEYEVDRATAFEDATFFIGQLLNSGYVELTKEDKSW